MNGGRAGRSRRRGRPTRSGYLALTFGLALAGVATAAFAGWADPGPTAAGAFGAWTIQAVAYWRLVDALDEGRDATGAWILGMGARFGGLVVAAIAAWQLPEGGMEILLAFGGAILAFLLLEAVWLARRPPVLRGRSPRPGPREAGGARSGAQPRGERPGARPEDTWTDKPPSVDG